MTVQRPLAENEILATAGAVPRGARLGAEPAQTMPGVMRAALVLSGFAVIAMLVLVFVPASGRVTGEASSGHAAKLIYLWGVSDASWMRILMGADSALMAMTMWVVYREWRATGRTPAVCALFVGWAAVGLIDPLVNWSMYVQYDPRLVHFPLSLPWANLPTIEPLWPLLGMGYAEWFLLQALLAGYLARRLVALPTARWARAHPMRTRLIVGLCVGALLDPIAEIFAMNTGMWTYWQTAGPTLHVGRAYLPMTEWIVAALVCAIWAALLHQDEQGRSVSRRIAAGFRPARRLRLGEVGVAVVLAYAFALICWPGVFGTLRLTGNATHISRPWHYSSMKVYDPNGLQPPGVATYRGVWAGK
jgi:Spirocyclase AveC-like